MLVFTPDEREESAARVLELLREDARVESAELAGSLATGTADPWSDGDVDVEVAEGADQREVADDWVTRAYESLPVLHHFAVAFGDFQVRGLLLESLLEVDTRFQPADAPEDEWPARDAEAEAGFAWHDVLH